jgi:CRISPR-associated Cas5-like protein
MTPHVFRRFVALVALVALAFVLSGCGAGDSLNDAATVTVPERSGNDTVHIDRAEFQKELTQLVDNSKFRDVLDERLKSDSSDTANSVLTSIYLTQRIEWAAFDAAFSSRKLELDTDARNNATDAANNTFGSEDVFKAFPKSFRDKVVDRYAREYAVLQSFAKQPTEAEVRDYYEQNKSQFACASGKNVAHILVADQSTATDIVNQLKGGAKFADLAAQKSTDTGSAQNGGDVGCLRSGAFVTDFQNAAEAAPLNTPVGPVKTEFGYHVILVTPYEESFAKVADQVAQALQQNRAQAATEARLALLKSLKVRVDPRYGSWGKATDAQGSETYRVSPPATPDVRNQREPTTTTTLSPATNGTP